MNLEDRFLSEAGRHKSLQVFLVEGALVLQVILHVLLHRLVQTDPSEAKKQSKQAKQASDRETGCYVNFIPNHLDDEVGSDLYPERPTI